MRTFIEEYANLGGGTTNEEQMKASWWLAAGAAAVAIWMGVMRTPALIGGEQWYNWRIDVENYNAWVAGPE